jgi:hypothetical protein
VTSGPRIERPPSAAEMIVVALRALLPNPCGDAATDANTALNSNYPLGGAKPARLNVGGLVVNAGRATFSYDYGAFLSGIGLRPEDKVVATEVLGGLTEPVVLLVFANATQNAERLRVTFDPRRAWLNIPGGPVLFNALKLRAAVAGDGTLDSASNEARVAKQLRIKLPRKEARK